MTRARSEARQRTVHPSLLVFVAMLAAYSVWDYVEHVTREGQEFGERPWHWLAFTVASMTTVIATMLAVHLVAHRATGRHPFLADAAGIALALQLHVSVSGPLFDRLSWGGGALTFYSPWTLILVLIAILGGIRAAVWAVGTARRRDSRIAGGAAD